MKKEKPATKTCKHCNTEIPYEQTTCPNCGKKQPKKRLLPVVAVVVVLLFALSTCGSNDSSKPEEKPTESTQTPQTTDETPNADNSQVDEPSANSEAEPAPSETMGQKNAVRKAKDYLNFTAFSYVGLIQQLEFEGFSTEEATYGADQCGADWNEQAALKAQVYLDYTSFSRDGLIEQLLFEGFTSEQAEYGVTAVGY